MSRELKRDLKDLAFVLATFFVFTFVATFGVALAVKAVGAFL